jgi:hypothetical protein
LIASAGNNSVTGVYSSGTDVSVTPVVGNNGSFYVLRHSDYSSIASTNYTLNLPTSLGTFSIPQLGGALTLNRRDSKIHVTDYPLGGAKLIYSTAEVFTWQKYNGKTVVVVYGGPGELHEMLIQAPASTPKVVGSGVTVSNSTNGVIAQWQTTTDRRILKIGNLHIYILGKF